MVVVEGPPGIGKTELLGALAASATTAGFEVLSARGGELEQSFAFGVVRQLFEALVAGLPASERRALFSGATALARPLLDPSAEPKVVSGSADPFPLLHGLYWLAANLAERRPLALVVDDAHWADLPSLRWLHYLARRLEGVPALVALAARSTIPEAPLEPIEAIKAEGSCALLRPTPLSEQASGTLLGQVFGSDPGSKLVHEAHRATQGNPFLLTELGRSLAADGVVPGDDAAVRVKRATPQTVGRSALARLARLPSAARRLARATALLGEDGELRHAAVLAGLGESEALAAADRLTAAGFLAATPRRAAPQLRFAHPLIRQALYADLPAGERAARHKDAARLLAKEPGTAERVAAHLMESIPRPPTRGSSRCCVRRRESRWVTAHPPSPPPTCAGGLTSHRRSMTGLGCCSSWAEPRRTPSTPGGSLISRPRPAPLRLLLTGRQRWEHSLSSASCRAILPALSGRGVRHSG